MAVHRYYDRIKNDLVDPLKLLGISTEEIFKKATQSDLGFHPDTVLSTFEQAVVYPKNMPSAAVAGPNFFAVRYAPIDNCDVDHAKVAFVYQRQNELWCGGKKASLEELSNYINLAQGKDTKLGDSTYRKI